MATKVFRYGALPPSPQSPIREQLNRAREYYNKLIEAENLRRLAIWAMDRAPKPHDHENGDGDKCPECAEWWRTFREHFWGSPPLDQKPFRARAKRDLYWGTYLMAEEAFSAAWKKTDCFSFVRFKSWKKGGVMGIQVQPRTNPDQYFRIDKAPDGRKGRCAGQRHVVRVRIGSSGKNIIWSDPIRIELHRPFEGRPKWVKICLSYRGKREIWSVNITCSDVPERTDNANSGTVAIDASWRLLPNGQLRLAYARGDDGAEYELTMNERWRERIARADRIRGYRDDVFNIIKGRFPYLKKYHKPSNARDRILRDNLNADIELEGWVRWDRHMEEYELGCRSKSANARRDALRVWIRNLRRRYSKAIIKNSSHKEMKDRKKAKEAGLVQAARRQGHHASPGETIEEITRVFGRQTGVAVINAAWTTATCPKCGYINDIGAELIVVCERCGAYEDRDRISTRNLLVSYFRGEGEKPTARKTTARFAKRHKKNDKPEQHQRDGL